MALVRLSSIRLANSIGDVWPVMLLPNPAQGSGPIELSVRDAMPGAFSWTCVRPTAVPGGRGMPCL